jgi:cbb3-type cytochrome oxidase maturation protein
MFIPVWLIFLATGLIMAVFAVVWGIRSRQFEDQDRARYLPLVGLTAAELREEPAVGHRAEYVAICAMLAVGITALGAGLVLALRFM